MCPSKPLHGSQSSLERSHQGNVHSRSQSCLRTPRQYVLSGPGVIAGQYPEAVVKEVRSPPIPGKNTRGTAGGPTVRGVPQRKLVVPSHTTHCVCLSWPIPSAGAGAATAVA